MSDEPDSVTRWALRALVRAEALGRIPTPLEDVAAAADLGPVEDIFDERDPSLPTKLRDVVKRLKGKVLGTLSIPQRVIYVDRSLTHERRRFTLGHEIGHEALPWHRDVYFGDDSYTIDPAYEEVLDAEANRFSSDLLFQLDKFTQEAFDCRFGIETCLTLGARWETSIHATLRRYVTHNDVPCALLVIGRIPVYPRGVPSVKVLSAVESDEFRKRYGLAASAFPSALASAGDGLGAAALAATRAFDFEVAHGMTAQDEFARPLAFDLVFNGRVVLALVANPRRHVRGRPVILLRTPAYSDSR